MSAYSKFKVVSSVVERLALNQEAVSSNLTPLK